MRFASAIGIVAALVAMLAPAGNAQSGSTVLQGGVTESARDETALQRVCHNSTVFSARRLPDQDPKRTAPGCAKDKGAAYGCNAPPYWPHPEDWKILQRQGNDCLVAMPLIDQDRDRLANRTLVTLKQVENDKVWRQCDQDPWDTTKVLCEKPPWTPPPRGNVGVNGACADGSNGGGPDSTNYYGCPTGPYLGRTPPTGSIPTPRGPSAYPRNRVVAQGTRPLTPEEWEQMKSPYYAPPTPTRMNDGSGPYNYLPPKQAPIATPPPQRLTNWKSTPSGYEFTFANGTRWKAPATTEYFNVTDQRLYRYPIKPDTAVYNYVNSGVMVQPFVKYGMNGGTGSFTINRPLTQIH